MHACPMSDGPKPHVGGPITKGVLTVIIDGQPAATVGSVCTCAGPPDMVAKGSSTVFIGGKPAARVGDQTAHGGAITLGSPTVIIGG
ncbi:MAG TPA: PAAR domain-containing protein [Kofleriaceae bacterium]|nr:PAAR domain-containing protein [Kofleriaceae bacterium]